MRSMTSHYIDLDRRVVFPFYIFLTLLMAYMGTAAVISIGERREYTVILSLILLFLLHTGLYWLNVLWVHRNTRWWLLYYPAQTIVMLVIVLLLNGRSTVGLSFLFSATIALVCEALGVWGNSRRAFFLGVFYIALLLGFLYLFADPIMFISSLTGLLVNGGSIILFMVMFNQLFAQRQKAMELAERLESANAQLAASNAKIGSLTLQNERQRIARELHDTLAQGVSGLVLQLEAVKAHLASNRSDRATEIVEHAITHARRTLAESRAAIDDLRAAPENIAETVRENIERFKQATGLPCDMEISIHENRLPDETVNHALNILRESLTNAARHAQATQVHVKWSIQHQTLELEVRDNGKGFDTAQPASGHYGLVGMQERARLAGGELKVESSKAGTCVRFVAGSPS
jgi:NarL family two-component system sensor histidine kinase YdfH